jgi:surface carbohydrate biosynthesis protein
VCKTPIFLKVSGLKKIAYLEVQIPIRDLDARLLLAHKLVGLGFDVIIGRTGQVFNAALSNHGGVYFTDFGFTNAGAEKVKALKERDIETFLFCEEVLAVARWDTYQVERVDIEALTLSKKVLVNNGLHRDIISQKSKRHHDFLNIGNSRFDLLDPQYRDIYASRVTRIREQYGNFVLICTNGAVGDVANFGLRISIEGFKDSLINQEMIGLMALQQYFIIEMLKLAELRTDLTFVVRAKPGEESAIKKLLPLALENVVFDCSDSIRPWVIAATHVVSNCCSTAFDSLAADTPSIVFQPEKWCEIKSEATDFVSHVTHTIDELSIVLDSVDRVKSLTESEIQYYFPNRILSTTDTLASLLNKSNMAGGSFVNRLSYDHVKRWRWFLKRKYFTRQTQWTGLITAQEVEQVLSKLDSIRNISSSIKRLGAELYLIKPEIERD